MSAKRAIHYLKTSIHLHNLYHLNDLNSKLFGTINQVLIPLLYYNTSSI